MSTRRPPGVSTRAHSASPAPWSTQWSKEVVLTTRSKLAAGWGSASAKPSEKRKPGIGGHGRSGDLDHAGRRVDAGEVDRAGKPGGHLAQQVTGPAPHVEHAPGVRCLGQRDPDGAVGDVAMQAPEPPALIAGCAAVEGADVTVAGHGSILPRAAAARAGRPRPAGGTASGGIISPLARRDVPRGPGDAVSARPGLLDLSGSPGSLYSELVPTGPIGNAWLAGFVTMLLLASLAANAWGERCSGRLAWSSRRPSSSGVA